MGAMGYLEATTRLSSHQRQLDTIGGRLNALESRIGSLSRSTVTTTYVASDTCPADCVTDITALQGRVTTLEATVATLTSTTRTLSNSVGTLQTSTKATCDKVCSILRKKASKVNIV